MQEAHASLRRCGIPLGTDFHALDRDQTAALATAADAARYRQPRNANGSRLRYFHDRLQRLAALGIAIGVEGR
jgi:hypothetical protein